VELSPEWRLLLACARLNLTDEDCRLIRDLARPDLDWDYIAKITCDHGVAPLIYRSFQKSGITNLLTSSAGQTLRSFYYGNAARNALLFAELHRMLMELRELNIDIIALKGAAMAETVYSHKALRPMADIDLLVRNPSLPVVERLLVQKGYRPDRNNEGWQEHHYHLGFFKDVCSTKIHFEIHWNIDYPNTLFKIDIEGMWERTIRAKVAGVEVLVLSPEDLLLHLCQHACKHKLNGIRPLCDIRETIGYYEQRIDWGAIGPRSAEWRIKPQVYLTLRLAKELLSADVPNSVLDAMEPPGFDDGLLDAARERVLRYVKENVFQDNASMVFEFYSKCSGLKGTLAALTEPFTPDVMARRYWIPSASKKIYLYYPILLKDLCVRYFSVLWRVSHPHRRATAQAERQHNNARLQEWLASSR